MPRASSRVGGSPRSELIGQAYNAVSWATVAVLVVRTVLMVVTSLLPGAVAAS